MDQQLSEQNVDREILDENDKEFCSFAGITGLVITLITIAQHLFLFDKTSWQTMLIYAILIFCFISFIYLTKKSNLARLLIMIGALLCFLYLSFLIYLYFFENILILSIMLIVQLCYMIIIPTLIKIKGLDRRLQLFNINKYDEDTYWNNKI